MRLVHRRDGPIPIANKSVPEVISWRGSRARTYCVNPASKYSLEYFGVRLSRHALENRGRRVVHPRSANDEFGDLMQRVGERA